MIGGYLSNPVDKYPDIFGNCTFLKEYPYFLPCFVAALVSFTGLIVGYFMLPETRKFKVKDDDESRILTPSEPNAAKIYPKTSYGAIGTRIRECETSLTDITNKDNSKLSTKKVDGNQKMISFIGISPITLYAIISNVILALHSIMADEIYTLFA